MSNLVRNYAGKRVAKSGTVYVYGAGFSHLTKAWLNSKEISLKDYDYGHAEFTVHTKIGKYSLYVGSDVADRILIGDVEICELTDLPLSGPRVPEKSADGSIDTARDAMISLLPRGVAWYKGHDGNFSRLMAGLANVVRSFYELAMSYRASVSPSHTDSFDVWESELALPRFSSGYGDSDTRRREEIFRINGKKGAATIPYLKSLLNLYGAKYDLYEYWKNPLVFPSWIAAKNGEKAKFFILVKVYQDKYSDKGANCNSNCNSSLGGPRDIVLESIIEQAKPAHVRIVYRYFVRILTDADGVPIVNNDVEKKMIIV